MYSSSEIALPPFSFVSIRHVYTCLHLRCESTEEATTIDNAIDLVDPFDRIKRSGKHIWIQARYVNMKTAIASVLNDIHETLGPLKNAAYLTVGSTNAIDGEMVYLGKVKLYQRAVNVTAKSTPFKPALTTTNGDLTGVVYETVDETIYHKLTPPEELGGLFIDGFRDKYAMVVNGLMRSMGININALNGDTKEIILRYACSIKQCAMISGRKTDELFDDFGDTYELSTTEIICVEEAAVEDDNTRDATI